MTLKMRTENGLVHLVVWRPGDGSDAHIRGYSYTACGCWLSPRPHTEALATCLWCAAAHRRPAP